MHETKTVLNATLKPIDGNRWSPWCSTVPRLGHTGFWLAVSLDLTGAVTGLVEPRDLLTVRFNASTWIAHY